MAQTATETTTYIFDGMTEVERNVKRIVDFVIAFIYYSC